MIIRYKTPASFRRTVWWSMIRNADTNFATTRRVQLHYFEHVTLPKEWPSRESIEHLKPAPRAVRPIEVEYLIERGEAATRELLQARGGLGPAYFMLGLFILLASLFSLTGCTEPLPVHVSSGATDNIDEACGILGIACAPSRRAFGAVELRIADVCDPDDEHLAGYMEDARCLPRGCSRNEPRYIAHELAHALDLEHVADVDNLMDIGARGTELDDAQLDTIEDAASAMLGCR